MIWRDDDIGVATKLDDLRAVDDLFQRYRLPHTIAVMAEGMDRRPDLVDFIRERRMIVQLHCWTHLDLTTEAQARTDLDPAAALIDRLFGRRPSVLYPPWNRSNDDVVETARELGMAVSFKKISLNQYLRCGGDAGEDTINFHYWHVPDVALLDQALQLESDMKITDYCPRAAPFDSYLKGRDLVGAEIGVDVGAHAEALLRYCDIGLLHLVDPWPNHYCRGYCESRLSVLGYRANFRMLQCGSLEAAAKFDPASLDFVYIDQEHGGKSVADDLRVWWPIVKPGGVLGYRNYSSTPTPLVAAIDAFVATAGIKRITPKVETGEIVLTKVC